MALFKKLSIIALLALVLFSACDNVVFEKPVPPANNFMKKFPEEYIGHWVQKKKGYTDNLYVEENSFRLESTDKRRSRQGTLDTFNYVLRKYRFKETQYYIINERSDSGYYQVRFVNVDDDGLHFYKLQSGNIDELQHVTAVKEIANDPARGRFYAIDPDKKALGAMLRNNLLFETDFFEPAE